MMKLKKPHVKRALRHWWHSQPGYKDSLRLKELFATESGHIKYLLPGRLWIESVSVVLTTKCNLRCPDCANLMPYYKNPCDVDHELLVASLRKLGQCVDFIDDLTLIGGEPFCNSRLKEYIGIFPREKCRKITIITNGTIIPQDPELYEVLRKQRVTIRFSSYPASQKTQEQFIALLQERGIDYEVSTLDAWYDYGKPVSYGRTPKQLKQQFLHCPVPCTTLLKGCVYYCARGAHSYDLGFHDRGEADFVDIMANSESQSRRKIRRLIWSHRPFNACQYCKLGSDECGYIARGK